MILNFGIKIIGWVGYIYVSTLWSLYAIQILFAIGEAIGTPSYDLLYSINLTKGTINIQNSLYYLQQQISNAYRRSGELNHLCSLRR